MRILLLVALVIAAAGAALAGVVAHAGGAKTAIVVTEREFKITLSKATTTAGRTRFLVKNTGKLPHVIAISGAGIKAQRTPLIKPGKSAVLVVDLTSGRYSIWCPLPGHAAHGMKATLTVPAAGGSGGAGTGTTPPPDTTTTDLGGYGY